MKKLFLILLLLTFSVSNAQLIAFIPGQQQPESLGTLLEFDVTNTVAQDGALSSITGIDWTVTRGSDATFVKDNGLISNTDNNMLIYSSDLTDSNYRTDITRALKTSSASINPFGGGGVVTVTDDGTLVTNAFGIAKFSLVFPSGGWYNYSVYVNNQRTEDWFRINNGGYTDDTTIYYDLVNEITYPSGTQASDGVRQPDSGIINLGNGWYRLWTDMYIDPADLQGSVSVYLANGNQDFNTHYLDGTNNFETWGWQISKGYGLNPFIETTNIPLLDLARIDYSNGSWVDTYGIEKIVNPTFDGSDGWLFINGASVSGGVGILDATSAGTHLLYTSVLEDTKTYFVEFEVLNPINLSNNYTYVQENSGNVIHRITTSGYNSFIFTVDDVSPFLLWRARDDNGPAYYEIDNVSVKEITGKEWQGSPAVLIEDEATNLVLYSEDFSSWTVNGTPILTSGQTNELTGLSDATKLYANSTFAGVRIDYNTFFANQTNIFSVYAKASDSDWIKLRSFGLVDEYDVNFDLANGVVGTDASGKGSIKDMGNGWYKCSLSINVGSDVTGTFVIYPSSGTTAYPVVGDAVLIWGSELKVGESSYIRSGTRSKDSIYVTVPSGASQVTEWIYGVEQTPIPVTGGDNFSMKNGTTKIVIGDGGTPPVASNGLAPTLSNFRTDNTNKERIYFNSSEPITATTFTGFAISYSTISSVTINSGETTGHYFTLASPLTFWDVTTIEYTGGSDLQDVDDSTALDPFTFEYVVNLIDEPTAPNTKYASATGSGTHDGLSEANAWSFQEMDNLATAGDHVWVKASSATGTLFFTSTGTASNPVIYEGYKVTPGDITSNYLKGGTYADWDDAEMPTIIGTSRLSDRGWEIRELDYVIFRNFQIRECRYGVLPQQNGNADNDGLYSNVVFENINGKDFGNSDVQSDLAGYYFNGNGEAGVFTRADKIQFIDNVMFNFSQTGILTMGDNWLFDGLEFHSTLVGNKSEVDYNVDLQGDRNVVINSSFRRYDGLNPSGSGGGFGVSMKARWPDGARTTRYNLVADSYFEGLAEQINFRWRDSQFNVAKRCIMDGGIQPSSGGVAFRDGAGFNIVENCIIQYANQDYYGFINYFDSSGEDGTGQTLEGNVVRNTIIIGGNAIEEATVPAINLGLARNGTDTAWTILNNRIENCTFIDIPEMYNLNTGVTLTNFEFTNNIVVNVPIRNSTNTPTIDETYSNHWAFWGTNGVPESGTGNMSINPLLDVNYSPGATFTDIDVPTISTIPHDYYGSQRNGILTTVGAVKHLSE